MKWISHCILLMSGTLAAQYRPLVMVHTCFAWGQTLHHPTSCPKAWRLPAHSWILPQALPLAEGDHLAPGSISSLGRHTFKTGQCGGTKAWPPCLKFARLRRAIRAPWLSMGFAGADWELGHSCISSTLPSAQSLSSFYLMSPTVSLLHANLSLTVCFPANRLNGNCFPI